MARVTSAQINERVESSREAARKIARDARDAFKQELFAEFGVENNQKRELLFEKAWVLGHANGNHEVRFYFEELVDLIL